MKEIKYKFAYIDNCNMCNTDRSSFKILGQRQNQSQGKKPNKNICISTKIFSNYSAEC